jgi:lipid-A-disaccharide synthase
MKVLLVTGEASGDLYGSLVARELAALRPGVQLLGAGSARMREAGVRILGDPTAFASIGAVEALKNLGHYRALLRTLTEALAAERPDVLVLVDFPDFNLRLAPAAARLGIPIVYYISPQLWAWRYGRIRQIGRLVRKVLVIFPFEEELYRREGIPVRFVGHPMLDVVASRGRPADLRAELGVAPGEPLVGLLPGSRLKQYRTLLPRMAEAARLAATERPRAAFVVAQAPTIPPEAGGAGGIPVARDRIHDVLGSADALLTASGTATVEAALYGVPMVVTYWVHPVAALTLGPLVRVPHYAMVNLLAGRRLVPELYQFRARPRLLAEALSELLQPDRREAIRWGLARVRDSLGGPGASRRAAEEILAAAC